MYNTKEYIYSNITGAATTQAFTGKGVLHSVVVNTANAGGTIKLIDNTTGTTANIGTITIAGSTVVTLLYDVVIANGLRIVTSASPDITVTYTTG
jgi:hypothetical protein